jgi:peptidoglycan/LPS O-acetylase OafA/YrhL
MAKVGYQPALDGLRGVAVLMVLAFHLELPGAQGGYLGVSVFFTLSGFLITRLLLAEYDNSGSIDLRQFYSRRIRRLLPASLLAIGLVVGLAAMEAFEASSRIRGSTLAALTSTFNWYELLGGRDYADLFAAPSPLAHFWSLAIEEQFYWLWPLALLALLPRVTARGRLQVMALITVAAAISAPLTAVLWSSAAAYLSTWSRAGEILVGAVAAAWMARRPHSPGDEPVELPARLAALAAPALIGIAVVTWFTPAGRGWAFEGGLPLFALLSVALVVGLQRPSFTAGLLSVRPLVWTGRVSYGVYLFHWPVIVWLTERRTGLDRWPLVGLQVAVTFAVTVVSYRLLEQPIRSGRVGRAPWLAVGLGASSVAVFVAAWALVATPPAALPEAPTVISAPADVAPTTPIATTPESPQPGTTTPVAAEPTAAPTTSAPVEEPRISVVAIFGDSVPAWLLRDAAPSFARTDVAIANGSLTACDGMVGLPAGRGQGGEVFRVPEECREWPESYPEILAATWLPVDVALLMLAQAPTSDRLVDGTWLGPCDGIGWYLDDVAGRIEFLEARDVDVVFAIPARPGTRASYFLPGDVGERFRCVREQVIAFLAERQVTTIDLDEFLCPEDDCDRLRADGVHVDPQYAPAILDQLLDRTLELTGR